MKMKKPKTKKAKKAEEDGRGRPSRALTAYNIFFANERSKLMEKQKEEGATPPSSRCKSHQVHVGFGNLARIVSKRWEAIDPVYKKELEEQARLDKIRYNKEMKAWRAEQGKDTAKGDESDFSTVADALERSASPAVSAADNVSEAPTFHWELHLPDDTTAEQMDTSFEGSVPVASVPNASAENKQSFGSLKSPDAYEATNTMFIEQCKEFALKCYPSGNKAINELCVYLKAWCAKQGIEAVNESDFAAVVVAPTEQNDHRGAAAASTHERSASPANANAKDVSAADDARRKLHLPDDTNAGQMDFSFEVLQPHGFPGMAYATAEHKQSFGSLKSPDAYEGTNRMFTEQCKEIGLRAQQCYPTGNKALDELYVHFGFVMTAKQSQQQPEGGRSTNICTATRLELEEMAHWDNAKYDKEMEERKASKALANSGDAAVWSPGASVFDSKEKSSPEKKVDDRKNKEAAKAITPTFEILTSPSLGATKPLEGNLPEMPLKFDNVKESKESSFCLPCITHPKPVQERPQQRSPTQTSDL